MASVVDHLLGLRVPFLVLPAPGAETPAEVAAAHDLDPAELVWTDVVMTASGPVAMTVGAGRTLDLGLARRAVHDPTARIATHEEIRAFARGCEPGTVPPLSAFLVAPVVVDEPIARRGQIVFAAGVATILVCVDRAALFVAEPASVAPLTTVAADPAGLSVIAPSRRAAFSGATLVPYHLRTG